MKKNLPPHSEHPSPPTQMEGNREHGTPWVQEKNRERKKRLVWSSASWSGFPRPPLPPSTAGCRPHSPAAPRCFSAAGSHQPRFRMGARRYGWEGVWTRGLRCQRPPPLEVGRKRIHLCCLLFFWTCPAICLSLSCSPATGTLWVWGAEGSGCMLDATLRVRGCREYVCRRRWVGGRAENPALPQKGEEVQKCCD